MLRLIHKNASTGWDIWFCQLIASAADPGRNRGQQRFAPAAKTRL